jgi:hypothetical protein
MYLSHFHLQGREKKKRQESQTFYKKEKESCNHNKRWRKKYIDCMVNEGIQYLWQIWTISAAIETLNFVWNVKLHLCSRFNCHEFEIEIIGSLFDVSRYFFIPVFF